MDPEHGYVGIHNDIFGGMTDLGRIIRDAWVFGILPEDETCEGWSAGRLQELYDKVHKAWEPYGHLASRLPADLLERHRRVYTEAVRRARSLGWSAELDEDD